MTKIPKINNDSESKRIQRNMTDTQKRNSNNIKEGKLVNAFVKDPNLSLDETLDTLVISQNEIKLPEKLKEKEVKKEKGLYYLALASLGTMGLLSGFTAMISQFSKKKFESSKEYLLPGITRNHCINDEIHQSIFSMIQSPNRKTILASLGVITLASMALLAKNFVDGFKDVWIKRQEADIQKNLQENLIAVETQSFSGKIQIIRSMLASKAKIFSNELKENKNNIPFTSKEKDKKPNNNIMLWTLGAITMTAIIGFGYFSIKNIRKSEDFLKKVGK